MVVIVAQVRTARRRVAAAGGARGGGGGGGRVGGGHTRSIVTARGAARPGRDGTLGAMLEEHHAGAEHA